MLFGWVAVCCGPSALDIGKNEEFADTRVLHSSVFSCLKQKNKKFYLFSPGKNTIIRTIPRKEKDFPP